MTRSQGQECSNLRPISRIELESGRERLLVEDYHSLQAGEIIADTISEDDH